MSDQEQQTKPDGGASVSTAGLGGPADEERGFWFSFKRGEWVKSATGTCHTEAGGLAYVGSLTKAQQEELDDLIRGYVDRIGQPPNVDIKQTPDRAV